MDTADENSRSAIEQQLELLRRAALRATVAARGRDARVDEALDELRKHINGRSRDLEAAIAALSAAIMSMEDDQAAANGHVSGDRTGWLQRLLPALRDTPVRAAAGARAALPVESVRAGLCRILVHLPLPASFDDQVDSLRAMLEGPLEPEALGCCVERVAELVVAAQRAESRELEEFLRRLTARLEVLDGVLAVQGAMDAARLEDSAGISSAIREDVGNIRESLDCAGDLRELREAISVRLDGMVTRMTRYHALQEQRHQESRRQLHALEEALVAAEEQAGELESSLSVHRRRAVQDPLTSLPNRQAYDERLRAEVQRWRRTGEPLSLVIGDIDRFKELNDRNGHQFGDEALCRVSEVLRHQIRSSDFLARYGGEEFVLLLPGVPLHQAAMVAEQLRYVLEREGICADDAGSPVTISFGVATFTGDEDADSVFRRADRALYRAKHAGRNRVVRLRSGDDDEVD